MEDYDKQLKIIFKIGAVTTTIVLCGIILDIVAGSVTGGDVAGIGYKRFLLYIGDYYRLHSKFDWSGC